MNMSMDIELMADMVHEVWANWMKYMFSQGSTYGIDGCKKWEWIMPAEKYERWSRQMNTPYRELTEKEKESDREIALRYLELIEEWYTIPDGE